MPSVGLEAKHKNQQKVLIPRTCVLMQGHFCTCCNYVGEGLLDRNISPLPPCSNSGQTFLPQNIPESGGGVRGGQRGGLSAPGVGFFSPGGRGWGGGGRPLAKVPLKLKEELVKIQKNFSS